MRLTALKRKKKKNSSSPRVTLEALQVFSSYLWLVPVALDSRGHIYSRDKSTISGPRHVIVYVRPLADAAKLLSNFVDLTNTPFRNEKEFTVLSVLWNFGVVCLFTFLSWVYWGVIYIVKSANIRLSYTLYYDIISLQSWILVVAMIEIKCHAKKWMPNKK